MTSLYVDDDLPFHPGSPESPLHSSDILTLVKNLSRCSNALNPPIYRSINSQLTPSGNQEVRKCPRWNMTSYLQQGGVVEVDI